MRYWVVSQNKENFDISMKKKLLGVSSRKKKIFSSLSVGDKIIFYVGRATKDKLSEKIHKFLCVAEVAGEVFEDDVVWWPPKSGDIFPLRRKIRKISPIDIYAPPISCQFSCVNNPLYWMLPFRSGLTEIMDEDWALIKEELS